MNNIKPIHIATIRATFKKACNQGHNYIYLLLLTTLWVFLAWPWLSGQKLIPFDSKVFHQPMTAIAIENMTQGILPYWNPFIMGGAPLLADPQLLLFSPLYMLLMLIGDFYSPQWFDTVQLLHVLLAGIGGYIYGRTQKMTAAAAVIAALLMMFGGVMASRMQHTVIIIALAYFPWCLITIHYMLNTKQVRWAIIAGLSIALLAIHFVQVAFFCCLLVAVYVVTDLASSKDIVTFWRKTRLAALPVSIALVILAVPLSLVMRYLSLSIRSYVEFGSASSVNIIYPASLLTTVIPNIQGSLGPDQYHGMGDMTEQYLYFGILPMATMIGCILFGIRQRDDKFMFWITIAIISLLYSLGGQTPIFRLFFDFVPGISLYRRPTDALFITNFALAMVLGHFFSASTVYCETCNNRFFYRTSLLVPLVAGLFILSSIQLNATIILYVILFMMLGLAMPIIAHYRPQLVNSKQFFMAMILLVTVDLFMHNINNPMNTSTWPGFALLQRGHQGKVPLINWLRTAINTNTSSLPPRIELAGVPANWYNAIPALGFESIDGYTPIFIKEYLQATGKNGSGTSNGSAPLLSDYESPFFNLLGVRYILARADSLHLKPEQFPWVYSGRVDGLHIKVMENLKALPRIFTVTELIYEPEIAKLMKDGLHYEVDFARQAILDREHIGNTTLVVRKPVALSAGPVGNNKIISYTPNSIKIESNAPVKRLLLINNIWHPDWKAFVDGRNVELLHTNILFQGVLLEPGYRLIELRFDPLHFLLVQR